jgi:hypothetical protein
LSISESTKKITGKSTDWPGRSSCSVKQKHCTLLNHGPAGSGVTLYVDVPTIGRCETLVTR